MTPKLRHTTVKQPTRYCGFCEACTSKRECPLCGADTEPIPKGVDPASLVPQGGE